MGNLFQILNQFVTLSRKNVIEKSLINWRVLPLVKINTRISDTPCICLGHLFTFEHNCNWQPFHYHFRIIFMKVFGTGCSSVVA
jgi:hypothetical protein